MTILFFVLLCLPGWALCTKKNKTHLRSSPSANAPVSWTVGKYYPLLKVKSRGNWYQVKDQDGDIHWVHRSRVTNNMKCLAVKVKRAELRTKPSFKSPFALYRYAEKYEGFERRKKQGSWYLVRNRVGGKGWLHTDQVWRPVKSITLEY